MLILLRDVSLHLKGEGGRWCRGEGWWTGGGGEGARGWLATKQTRVVGPTLG